MMESAAQYEAEKACSRCITILVQAKLKIVRAKADPDDVYTKLLHKAQNEVKNTYEQIINTER